MMVLSDFLIFNIMTIIIISRELSDTMHIDFCMCHTPKNTSCVVGDTQHHKNGSYLLNIDELGYTWTLALHNTMHVIIT